MEYSKFWQDRSSWPVDHPGFVFLGRLLLRLGAATYDDWKDGDIANSRKILENYNTILHMQKLTNERAARQIYPPPPPSPLPPPVQLTDRERRASEIVGRFTKLQRQIASAGAGGKFVTFTRPTAGGIPKQIPNSVWFTERLGNRFACCLMRRDNPFSTGIAGDKFEYVYVDEAGAIELIASAGISYRTAGDPQNDVAAANKINREVTAWLSAIFEDEKQKQHLAPTIVWTKLDFLNEVRSQVGMDYSARQFDYVWSELVKAYEHRKKSGPRPKYSGTMPFTAPPIRIG